eukprot:10211224-Alexandrium_andersonii.AAC.1
MLHCALGGTYGRLLGRVLIGSLGGSGLRAYEGEGPKKGKSASVLGVGNALRPLNTFGGDAP